MFRQSARGLEDTAPPNFHDVGQPPLFGMSAGSESATSWCVFKQLKPSLVNAAFFDPIKTVSLIHIKLFLQDF